MIKINEIFLPDLYFIFNTKQLKKNSNKKLKPETIDLFNVIAF